MEIDIKKDPLNWTIKERDKYWNKKLDELKQKIKDAIIEAFEKKEKKVIMDMMRMLDI